MMMETKQDINWARVCDTCQFAPSTLYCRADSSYLCTGCDAANRVASLHEGVRVCDACERAPSAFLCKADASSLCTSCDADIHSANPLATRHHRVPVLPIPGCLFGPPATDLGGTLVRHGVGVCDAEDRFLTHEGDDLHNNIDDEDEEEAASWLLTNPVKNETNQINGFLFGGEVDDYLGLVDFNPGAENSQFVDQFGQQECSVPQKSCGGDSIVPVHGGEAKGQLYQQHFQPGFEFDPSKAASYSYNGSVSQNVSSSLDASIVPDSTMSDISISNSRPTKGAVDFFSGTSIQMPTQLSPIDREARVLRYREKKKARKFEKTIRYASRKAYAETRPRIKGRFARRTDVEVEVDRMFSTTLMAETEYGIVPSFCSQLLSKK